jgi:hypothetical protein
MKEDVAERLGAPALRLAGFGLWVHGYQFPDAADAWDGNWLRVTAHCGAGGASVWVSGAVLDTVSVLRFRDGLAALHASLAGSAELSSHEPNVVVRASAVDRAGHVTVRVELTPDHLTQGHWFEFEVDQSYLQPAIAQCGELLGRFPVRDAPNRISV